MSVMVLLILHEYIITKLGIFAAVTAGSAVRAAVRSVCNIEHLTVRTAGSVFQSPPVILCRKIVNIFFFKSGSDTVLCTFLIPWCILITFKYSGCKMVCIKSEDLCQQFKAPLAALLLEIIAKTPASQHLKEGYMAPVTYGINIIGTDTTLHVTKPCSKRMLLSKQVRHQGLHAGYVEKYTGRSVRYQGNCSYIHMSSFNIKLLPGISQFI